MQRTLLLILLFYYGMVGPKKKALQKNVMMVPR